MANLGPLTTTFIPSPGCESVIWGKIFTEYIGSSTITHKYHSLGLNWTSDCYPTNFFPTSAFYSPASICPWGWSSACGSPVTVGTLVETRATCCPLGYSCIDPTTDEWSTLSCSSAAISSVTVTVPDLSNQESIVTVLDRPLIHAAAIDIRWQKLEVASSTSVPSAPAPSTLLPAPTTGSSSLTSSTASPAETNQPLTVGTKVGIGVTTFVIVLLAVIVYLVYRLRKIKLSRGIEGGSSGSRLPDRPELPTPEQNYGPPGSQHHSRSTASPFALMSDAQKQEMITDYNRHEAEAAYVYEVHNNPRPSELPSSPYTR